MADVTITIDGNTTQLVTSAKKAQEALKSMGQGAKDTGTAMSKAGSEFEKAIGKLARGAVIAKAIASSLKAAADEYAKIKDEQKALAKGELGSRVDIAREQQRLGLKGGPGGVAARILTQSGATSEAERVGFLSGLSEDDDAEDNSRALSLFSTGAHTKAEITKALKEGTLDDLERGLGARKAALGPGFKRLTEEADQARSIANENFDVSSEVDIKKSQAARMQELERLRSPGLAAVQEGIHKGIGSVPLIGGGLETISRTTTDMSFKILGVLEGIRSNTSTSGKLNVNESAKDE